MPLYKMRLPDSLEAPDPKAAERSKLVVDEFVNTYRTVDAQLGPTRWNELRDNLAPVGPIVAFELRRAEWSAETAGSNFARGLASENSFRRAIAALREACHSVVTEYRRQTQCGGC